MFQTKTLSFPNFFIIFITSCFPAYNDVGSAVIRDYSKANEANELDAAEGSFHPGFIIAIVLAVLILSTLAALLVGYRFYNCRRLYQAAYLYLAVPSNSQSTAQTIITVEEHSVYEI
uniref:Uncharacterized protein n=1 Tax=Biomphalaria glabrata TaxID=6526 RepID=A0A2C9LJ97_BIOGL